MYFINYLVSQRRPLVQLDDDLAVLLSISTCTKLYKILNLDGLDAYKVSNLCHENQYGRVRLYSIGYRYTFGTWT